MASEKPGSKPSDQLKARLGAELLSEVDNMGRMARRLCESSQSQQVLAKAAKKMATSEVTLDHTQQSLSQMEMTVGKLHQQADRVATSIEETHTVAQQFNRLFPSFSN